jgi:class 3 adenylate cyclase
MQEWITTSMPDLPMRIGIHSGDVVAGVIWGDKFQYDIRGDAVNIAARSESVGKPEKVNITHALYEKVKWDERFCFETRWGIDVKGKEVPIDMYFVSKKGWSE